MSFAFVFQFVTGVTSVHFKETTTFMQKKTSGKRGLWTLTIGLHFTPAKNLCLNFAARECLPLQSVLLCQWKILNGTSNIQNLGTSGSWLRLRFSFHKTSNFPCSDQAGGTCSILERWRAFLCALVVYSKSGIFYISLQVNRRQQKNVLIPCWDWICIEI